MVGTKAERLQIRVDEDEKRLIELAAEASHLSVSAFVVQSAASRAVAVLADRHLVRLGPAAADAFSRALEEPARVNERLAAALSRPPRVTWLD